MWSKLLNKFNASLKKISTDSLLCICYFGIAVLSWSNQCIDGWKLRYAVITVIGTILLYLSSIVLIPHIDNKRGQISLVRMVVLIILSMVMVVSAIVHRIDNLLFPLILVFVFPVCWHAWIKVENCEIVYLNISKGVLASFIIFFIVSMIFSPITIYQYTGIFKNCNGTAQYLTAVLPCVLYLISKTNKYAYWLCASCCCVVMLFTKSRTGLLAMIFILLFWIFFEIRYQKSNGSVHNIVKGIVFFVAMCIVIFPVFWGANRFFMYTVQDKYCLNAYEQVMKERGQTIYDVDFDWYIHEIDNRVSVGEKSINEYSSGRIGIWSDYLQEMNLWGHSRVNDGLDKNHSTAHNAFLQIAYDYGVVAGVIYVVCIIYVSLKSLYGSCFNFSKENLFSLTIILGYGVTAMLASNVFPFTYLITCLFYLTLNGIMVKNGGIK